MTGAHFLTAQKRTSAYDRCSFFIKQRIQLTKIHTTMADNNDSISKQQKLSAHPESGRLTAHKESQQLKAHDESDDPVPATTADVDETPR